MKICPYLGKVDDQATPVLFPAEMNGCYRGKRLVVPELSHQEKYCLSGLNGECQSFLDAQNSESIPILRIPDEQRGDRNRRNWIALLIAIVFLGLVLFLIAGKDVVFPQLAAPLPQISEFPTMTFSPTSTTEATMNPSATMVETMTASETPLEVSETPTIVPVLALETPIGGEPRFVLHLLQAGDSFTRLAAKYDTSIEAISLVNYKLKVPLQEGKVIVVPVGSISVDMGLPVFEPYQVSSGGTVVEDLAKELNTDINLLLSFNNLVSGQVLPKGMWLIIPRQRQ